MAFRLDPDNTAVTIRQAKQKLRSQSDVHAAFTEMSAAVKQEIAGIVAARDRGEAVIPILDYKSVINGEVHADDKMLIRQRGCVVIRNTFPTTLAEDWNQQIGAYVTDNGYYETPDKGLDNYFASLQTGKPQILSVYWSKPQIAARQHENLAVARRFLNGLWDYPQTMIRGGQTDQNDLPIFNPGQECTYADRTRRREPGDSSLGLKPHMDGGSVERWLDEQGFHQVYRHLISGDWQQYNPFEATYRPLTQEIPSPAVCSMFRTFQGWTALTPQGPGDGTLQLIPCSRALGWMFLRALQDDVPDTELCGATPGRALQCVPEWHQLVLDGLCSIPQMQPGDTVWWHPDVVHAVEDEHQGQGYSNVIYIGAAPDCAKNRAYLQKQQACFSRGESAPDFAAEHYELNYQERATVADLTTLGRRQMGIVD